jgi:hypothetical protein
MPIGSHIPVWDVWVGRDFLSAARISRQSILATVSPPECRGRVQRAFRRMKDRPCSECKAEIDADRIEDDFPFHR